LTLGRSADSATGLKVLLPDLVQLRLCPQTHLNLPPSWSLATAAKAGARAARLRCARRCSPIRPR